MELTIGQLNGSMSSLVTDPIEEKHGSRVSEEIDVAFMLRNILEVPEVHVDGYLKHLGDPLEGWNMDLCGNCDEMVVKAKQIYQEMVDAKRRFKEVKFEIISKIMSIQQGIKCEDKEPEVDPEENEFQDGTSSGGDFPQIANVYSVDELMIEGRVKDEDSIQIHQAGSLAINQVEVPKIEDFSVELGGTEEPTPVENDNMLDIEYHFKTEPQFPQRMENNMPELLKMSKGIQCSEGSSIKPDQDETLSRSRKTKQTKTRSSLLHQYRQLAVSKDPNALHGLVKWGHKKLPNYDDGPVQCKCGKQFSQFVSLCRHVKEVYEEPFRCEICFQAQPGKLVTFKRKGTLNRHVQKMHQIERPLLLSEGQGIDLTAEPEQETRPGHEGASSKKRKTMSSKFRRLAFSKDPNALHGLVKWGHKKLPNYDDGPVQCKCGKVYGEFATLVRHVKDFLQGPVRCEICFQSQPSKLVTFTRKYVLNRHIVTVHQGKLSPCPECGKPMRSEVTKKHLKFCRKK